MSMKYVVVAVFLSLVNESSFKMSSTTLHQRERIKILRQRINKEIQSNLKFKDITPLAESYSYENYDDTPPDNGLLTPIMKNDVKNYGGNFKMTSMTTTSMSSVKNTVKMKAAKPIDNGSYSQLRSHRPQKIKKVRIKKPKLIFYRRMYDEYLLNEPTEWTHCQDMISPFLNGVKKKLSEPRALTTADSNVNRFLQLLNVNTTAYSKDEIYSIIYQISNLQLRLFQWDPSSIRTLMNVIIKGKRHSLHNLKHGLQELFAKWRLDISNVTSLLKQARIFRPPCVRISDMDGSTKSGKIVRYTKPQRSTTPCDDDDDCKDPE